MRVSIRARKSHGHRLVPDWSRLGAVAAVVVALGTLLGLGAAAGRAGGGLRARQPSSSLLAASSLHGHPATVWSCPGPLQLNRGGAGSVAIADPGGEKAKVTLRVAETAVAPGEFVGRPLPTEVSHLVVDPGTSVVVPITAETVPARDIPRPASSTKASSKGKKSKGKQSSKHDKTSHVKKALPVTVEAAVSLTVSGAAVGVSESAAQRSGVETSPCALGAATHGYTASGLTFDSSKVRLAVFDPSAAPAVVNLSIGTPAGPVMPAGLQGIVVPANSLAVLDLAHYVPQQGRLAVTATASFGHVVIGSLTTVAAHFEEHSLGKTHRYTENGSELAVGVGRPLRRLVLPIGPTAPADSEAVRLYDPGQRAAKVVMVATEGEKTSRLSFTVGPGETVSEAIPVFSSPAKAGVRLPGGAFSSGGAGGYVRIETTNGVGVVAEHETVVETTPGKLTLLSSQPVLASSRHWLVVGAVREGSLDSVMSLTDAGHGPQSALVEKLPAGLTSSPQAVPATLGSYSLKAGVASGLDVGKLVADGKVSYFSVLVRTNGPSLVTEDLIPSNDKLLPAVASAIPVR